MELDIKLIQETFELLKPRAEEFSHRFYERLFQDFPQAQPLFSSSNMDKQKRLLVASLVQIVNNLEQPEFLGEYLGKMGERHVAYGTEDEHFEWVGLSLLRTLQDMFGADWKDTYTKQWALAFDLIAALMREGMQRAKINKVEENSPKVVPLRKAEAASGPKLILNDEIRQQLDQLAKQYVEEAARKYFEEALQREMKAYSGKELLEKLKKAS